MGGCFFSRLLTKVGVTAGATLRCNRMPVEAGQVRGPPSPEALPRLMDGGRGKWLQ
jgi:hypothetical protein